MSQDPADPHAIENWIAAFNRYETLPPASARVFALRCALRLLPLTAPEGRFPAAWRWESSVAPVRACFIAICRLLDATPPHSLMFQLSILRSNLVHADDAHDAAAMIVAALTVPIGVGAPSHTLRGVDPRRALRLLSAGELAVIQEEFAWLDTHEGRRLSTTPEALSVFSKPLWPRAEPATLKRIAAWSEALRQQAVEKSAPKFAILEADRVIRGYESLLRGEPDWRSVLGPERYPEALKKHPAALKSETEPAPVRPELPPNELALLLARLAYRDPALLVLAEAPTRAAFERLVSQEQRDDLPTLADQLADDTGAFEPDPLWSAWVISAHADFFKAYGPKTPDAPPVASASPLRAAAPALDDDDLDASLAERPRAKTSTRKISAKRRK